MKDNFEFYYIANSCLLVTKGSTKILIDGPYNDKNDFDPLEEDVREDIIAARGVFSGLDGLLFTHGHEDHFDCGEMVKCLACNKELTAAAPADCFMQDGAAEKDANTMEGRITKLIGDKGVFRVKDLDVHYYRTKHMAVDRDEEIDHYAFVIESGESRIFISGDMEMDDEITEAVCAHGDFDGVFINPVVPQNKKWFENFMRINTAKRYVYHLPSEENDTFFYRRAAVIKAKKQNAYNLLLDKMQKLDS